MRVGPRWNLDRGKLGCTPSGLDIDPAAKAKHVLARKRGVASGFAAAPQQ